VQIEDLSTPNRREYQGVVCGSTNVLWPLAGIRILHNYWNLVRQFVQCRFNSESSGYLSLHNLPV
jgi:hypothetical protein